MTPKTLMAWNPRWLKYLALAGVLFPLSAFGQATSNATNRAEQNRAPNLVQAARLIVETTNAFRRDKGLPPAELNPKLSSAALEFANFMAREHKYSHHADGRAPADRAKIQGYDFCLVSENIAYQYASVGFSTEELAQAFFRGWQESPGHRKNMLDPDVTETGVGLARGKTGYFFAVQMFGRPKSKSITFEIANQSDATVEYMLDEEKFSLPPQHTRMHEQCRPPKLTVQWPDGQKTTPLTPKNGDHYVVSRTPAGKLQIVPK